MHDGRLSKYTLSNMSLCCRANTPMGEAQTEQYTPTTMATRIALGCKCIILTSRRHQQRRAGRYGRFNRLFTMVAGSVQEKMIAAH
jgi:hypothetical protein